MLEIDHLAIAAGSLDAGAVAVERALGVALAPGGTHPAMGTHNRLLSLGATEYLEVIAIDPGAPGPDQPRWFDLDNFTGPARATTWICRVRDLDAALAACPDGVGRPWPLERGDLRWRMAIPENGKLPFDGLFPALIEWEGSAHPAARLPDRAVRLEGLTLVSPHADALRASLAPLVSDPRLTVEPGKKPMMRAVFRTPDGPVTL